MYFVPKITIISFLTEYQKYANIVYEVNQHLYVLNNAKNNIFARFKLNRLGVNGTPSFVNVVI